MSDFVHFFISFLVAGVIMAIIDALWLSVVANKFYKGQIGKLLLDKPKFVPAIIFYVLYIIGIVVFVVSPAIEKDSLSYALGFGALFGLVAYATYDLTNLSTIKGFTNKLVIVDLMWGTSLTAAVSVGTYLVMTKWIL